MKGRLVVIAGSALCLASSALRAAPPVTESGTSEPAPLLTLPPLAVPAAVPASDSRLLPPLPVLEPLPEPEFHEPEFHEQETQADDVPVNAEPLADQGAPMTGSVSCGSTNRGALHRPAELESEGPGYVIPDPWRSRQLRYGTAELVGLIERAAARVGQDFPDATLGVADLSDYDGGAIPRHRSHQSGRDVDLIFYATDEAGRRMAPDQYMPWFNRRGRASYARQPEFERNIALRYFDTEANWALARALLTDPHVDIERIFVSRRIERWLLRHARDLGEPEELVRRAQRVLHHPRNGDSHNDHMHVRILCSEDDVWRGRCRASSAPSRRRLYTNVRCPHPLRRRPTQVASTGGNAVGGTSGTFAFPAAR